MMIIYCHCRLLGYTVRRGGGGGSSVEDCTGLGFVVRISEMEMAEILL